MYNQLEMEYALDKLKELILYFAKNAEEGNWFI